MGHSLKVAAQRHRKILALHSHGFTQKEIADDMNVTHTCVSDHIRGRCHCEAPEYIYVPASWFRCRLCGGGWFERNGCRHSWELVV